MGKHCIVTTGERVVLLRNSDSVLECFEHSELECSRYVTEQARTESRVT